jgi:hypothetical protein
MTPNNVIAKSAQAVNKLSQGIFQNRHTETIKAASRIASIVSALGMPPDPHDTTPRKSQNAFISVATVIAHKQATAKIREMDELVFTKELPHFQDGECSPHLVCFESHSLATTGPL